MTRPRPTQTLCACIDDFGLDAGCDAAALELVGMGRVHAVSVMTATAGFDVSRARELQRLARGAAVPAAGDATGAGAAFRATGAAATAVPDATATPSPHADVGLHFDLTHDAGVPLPRLMRDAWRRRLDPRAVEAALHRQLSAFEQTFGCAPDHVDGHQHVHQFPVVRDVLVRHLGERYGSAPRRPWVRLSGTGAGTRTAWLRRVRSPKAAVIDALGAGALRRRLDAAGFAHNDALLGVYGFDDDDGYGTRLRGWLGQACTGDLLMCHPARDAAAAAGAGTAGGPGQRPQHTDPIRAARLREHTVWTGPQLPQWLDEAGVRLAAPVWRQRPAPGPAPASPR